MTESSVAIVGSGIVATTLAYLLTQRGHDVVIFEKGPEYPYPHRPQFEEHVLYATPGLPGYELPRDLKHVTLSGDYGRSHADIDGERGMVVGGTATHWGGVAVRMRPSDFQTKSRYGYGDDWPITYDDIEPYYCRAETLLGVSGTDADNPFAPPRSQPFPLPPFELAYDDAVLAERLRKDGIIIHTTPNARTRQPYDGRPQCVNFGSCGVCPIGARYSPNHHLVQAVATGRCVVRSNVSVRRIVLDNSGRVRALSYRPNDADHDAEHAAKVIIVAAGALESTRLLLLSTDSRNPDGVGNRSGQVGQHLVFHHYHGARLRFREALYPGRVGAITGQCQQFLEPPTRGRHGGFKIDFSSWLAQADPLLLVSAEEVLADLDVAKHCHYVGFHSESVASPRKSVTLSGARDRFGDRFAHVHYDCADFDYETHRYARAVYERFARATGSIEQEFQAAPEEFASAAHHMGSCRMGTDPRTSVVDPFCRVHGHPNLLVVGAGSFVGGSGGVHPTLTITALAIRAADYVLAQLL